MLHIDDRSQLEIAVENGLKIGKDVAIMGEVILDPGHCWLIEIGNNVTIAPRVHILAHDASTKRALGYTKISRVIIGDNVFLGAGCIILPGVSIGNNVVVGAGSVVTKNVPDNSVCVGNPASVIDNWNHYMDKNREKMITAPLFDESYQIGRITEDRKQEMIKRVDKKTGYVV